MAFPFLTSPPPSGINILIFLGQLLVVKLLVVDHLLAVDLRLLKQGFIGREVERSAFGALFDGVLFAVVEDHVAVMVRVVCSPLDATISSAEVDHRRFLARVGRHLVVG